jgi:hypothetical protein
MIYPKIRIQYLPKHPPFDMDEEVKKLHDYARSFAQVSSSFFRKTVLLDI